MGILRYTVYCMSDLKETFKTHIPEERDIYDIQYMQYHIECKKRIQISGRQKIYDMCLSLEENIRQKNPRRAVSLFLGNG